MSRCRVLFDLDGPILDVRPRYYHLYSSLTQRLGGQPLSLDDYWRGKRNRISERELAQNSGLEEENLEKYLRERSALIETEEWLKEDQLWPWSISTLDALRCDYELVLITQRSHRDRLIPQLKALGIHDKFSAIISGRGNNSATAKVGMLLSANLPAAPTLAFIGDTEVDLLSAQQLGIPAVAVATGIRSRERLLAHKPHALLESLEELPQWLEARPNTQGQ